MSKYQPLTDRLAGRAGDDWRVGFAELETLLGFPLPKAARAGGAWWANSADKTHSRAWLDAGWRVDVADRAGETVTFRRDPAVAASKPTPAPANSMGVEVKRAAGGAALIGGALAVAALALRLLRRKPRV